jgi:hypothetical protein
MSTRSTIWIKKDEDKYDGIYCHFDGYLDGVGKTLIENYTDINKVIALIELGAISSLGKSIECPEKHSLNNPIKGYTVAYFRDDKEESEICIYKDKSLNEIENDYSEEYNYIFDNNKWYYFKVNSRDMKEVVI